MKALSATAWAAVVLAAGCCVSAPRLRAEEQASEAGAKTVFVLPVKGPIDKSMLYIFRRAFRLVRSTKPAAVIIEIDTEGGRLKETEEIIAWVRSVEIPVYAFVTSRATSAGAIISLGCDEIFMAPGSTIGSAMPIMINPNPLAGGVQELPPDVHEKILSVVRAMVRGLAEENGHDKGVAAAMVDRTKEVKIGERIVCTAEDLLNLTAEEAVEIIPPREKPLLARSIVENIDQLLKEVGLEGARIIRFEEKAAESLARYITMIGPILLLLGLLGLFIEFKTPGFGLPGIAGIVFLGIFLFGHYVAGLAGLENIMLVLVGVVLLAVEIFVIPGFGVTGFLGLVCVAAGLILSMVPYLPTDIAPLPDMDPISVSTYVQMALLKFLLVIVLTVTCCWALSIVLPKTSIYGELVLQAALSQDEGFVSTDGARYSDFIGRRGTATTLLRPAGIAMFGGERLDVVSSGDLISRGTDVIVIEVQGARVVVEKAPSPQADQSSDEHPADDQSERASS